MAEACSVVFVERKEWNNKFDIQPIALSLGIQCPCENLLDKEGFWLSIIDEIAKKAGGKTASDDAIKSAENSIGFEFPDLLRSVYAKVANGGIGPGHKILGVKGGHLSDEGETISELYVELSASDEYDPLWVWPKGTIPFCDWGGSIYSCVDVTKEGAPVVWFDPDKRDMGEPMEQQFKPHLDSLESWFQAWLKGEDLRP